MQKAPVLKAVLFGSVARGDEEAGSDIDLFLLVNDDKAKAQAQKQAEALAEKCLELFGNALSPYILTLAEYKQPRNKKLIDNINGGITIYDEEHKNTAG